MFGFVALESGFDGVFQVVLSGFWTAFPKGKVLVIDTAAIDQIPIRVENGGFGRDGDAGDFY
jgi:hypothetical protein